MPTKYNDVKISGLHEVSPGDHLIIPSGFSLIPLALYTHHMIVVEVLQPSQQFTVIEFARIKESNNQPSTKAVNHQASAEAVGSKKSNSVLVHRKTYKLTELPGLLKRKYTTKCLDPKNTVKIAECMVTEDRTLYDKILFNSEDLANFCSLGAPESLIRCAFFLLIGFFSCVICVFVAFQAVVTTLCLFTKASNVIVDLDLKDMLPFNAYTKLLYYAMCVSLIIFKYLLAGLARRCLLDVKSWVFGYQLYKKLLPVGFLQMSSDVVVIALFLCSYFPDLCIPLYFWLVFEIALVVVSGTVMNSVATMVVYSIFMARQSDSSHIRCLRLLQEGLKKRDVSDSDKTAIYKALSTTEELLNERFRTYEKTLNAKKEAKKDLETLILHFQFAIVCIFTIIIFNINSDFATIIYTLSVFLFSIIVSKVIGQKK